MYSTPYQGLLRIFLGVPDRTVYYCIPYRQYIFYHIFSRMGDSSKSYIFQCNSAITTELHLKRLCFKKEALFIYPWSFTKNFCSDCWIFFIPWTMARRQNSLLHRTSAVLLCCTVQHTVVTVTQNGHKYMSQSEHERKSWGYSRL